MFFDYASQVSSHDHRTIVHGTCASTKIACCGHTDCVLAQMPYSVHKVRGHMQMRNSCGRLDDAIKQTHKRSNSTLRFGMYKTERSSKCSANLSSSKEKSMTASKTEFAKPIMTIIFHGKQVSGSNTRLAPCIPKVITRHNLCGVWCSVRRHMCSAHICCPRQPWYPQWIATPYTAWTPCEACSLVICIGLHHCATNYETDKAEAYKPKSVRRNTEAKMMCVLHLVTISQNAQTTVLITTIIEYILNQSARRVDAQPLMW